jgi:sugar phosphate isomerase/epimerase
MRISLCNEVIAALSFRQQCRLAKALGYDGLEIAPFTLGDEPHRLSANECTVLRTTAQAEGVAITGLHYILRAPAGLSITDADARVRERTVEVMRGLCELARALGATIVVHGSPDQRRIAAAERGEGMKRAADCFAAVAKAAQQAGVTYCIEPLSPDQTACINSVAEAADIVQQINSPAIKTMIDCSSAARGGETERIPDLIARWVPTGLIAHVHFNDPNRRGPGEGELPFGPILAALRQHGYAGDAAVEPFIYEPNPQTCAARSIGYIRGVMDGLA